MLLAVICSPYADMAELADAHGSGPCGSNIVEVRILLSAPQSVNGDSSLDTFFILEKI